MSKNNFLVEMRQFSNFDFPFFFGVVGIGEMGEKFFLSSSCLLFVSVSPSSSSAAESGVDKRESVERKEGTFVDSCEEDGEVRFASKRD